ncbi:MAG: 4Fe-4S dicluster domain-containing protein [Clostridiales bacterium]|nr:4Fe-4S dicluster domain-containing protein [Clostridiales bacterium]
MINLYTSKSQCCGCTACMSVCPERAITMKPDENGFLYPVIDSSLCIECKLCKKVCSFQYDVENPCTLSKPLKTYAAILKDTDFLKNSASGGAFVALAMYTLHNNGVVFGCTMNDGLKPEHICIDSFNDIHKLQGSKYVQSDLKDTYYEIKKYLKSNRLVLFTGTPCQVAGLKSYLGKEYDNLITADLICHGVPSYSFFKSYIQWIEWKLEGKIIDFRFRIKEKCWGHGAKVVYKKNGIVKEKSIVPIESCYYYYFLKGYIYRESCYECPYAGPYRIGDFTFGDYWGIDKVHPEVNRSNGVSLVLVNTQKGLQIINGVDPFNIFDGSRKYKNSFKINDCLYLIESDFEKARQYNGQLNYPVIRHKEREIILNIFREEGFKAVADKYYNDMKKQIIMYKIKAIIPTPIKSKIKKILKRT